MPRDLFEDVSDPSVRVGSQSRYSVPLSMLAHLVGLVAVLIVPLMATGALPSPRSIPIVLVTPTEPDLPSPPPQRITPPVQRTPVAPDAAPVDVPQAITPETGLEVDVERHVPSIEGALPGAVTEGLSTVLAEPPPPPARPTEPVRPGGKISTPTKLRDVAPIYPPLAQAARVQGVVILEAVIGEDGRVRDARVLQSIPLLDQAALAAVRRWEYSPTRLNGVPVAVVMTVTVKFALR